MDVTSQQKVSLLTGLRELYFALLKNFRNVPSNIVIKFQMKPKVAPKKPNISMQNPGKLARPVSACPQFSQVR